ncbi:MAG: pyridoxal-phosphate dependent enzyme, partial [Bacteroidota bacterium]
PICRESLDAVVIVPEGKICVTLLQLYNRDAIVVEPAGAMSMAALDHFSEEIKGRQVVCVVSGGNNDITRTAEIKERALLYNNLKHYFIVKFPQRAGALKQFVADILGPDDDITHFEYTKKSNRENGSAVVGLELKSPDDLSPLVERMKFHGFFGDYLNDKPELFQFLV